MKIVIQNVESQGYLTATGSWAGNAAEAADFEAILRAYKFAQCHTSGPFQIALFCPEDNYLKNIIGGTGLVAPASKSPAGGVQIPVHCLDAKGEFKPAIAPYIPSGFLSKFECALKTGFAMN